MPSYTCRCEYVRCGKPNCSSCPHGPYWYGYWREGKRTRKRYFGRKDPHETVHADQDTLDPWDKVLRRETCSLALCKEILGLAGIPTEDEGKAAYKRACLLHHPDRGGSHERMLQTNAAWSYVKSYYGW